MKNKIKPFVRYRIFESSESTVDECVLFGSFSYKFNSFLLSFPYIINVWTYKSFVVKWVREIQEDHGKYDSLIYQRKFIVLVLIIY